MRSGEQQANLLQRETSFVKYGIDESSIKIYIIKRVSVIHLNTLLSSKQVTKVGDPVL